jgi:hypothetical protein
VSGPASAPRWKPYGNEPPAITDADLDYMIAHATPIRRDASGKPIWPWPYAGPTIKPTPPPRDDHTPPRAVFQDNWRDDFV